MLKGGFKTCAWCFNKMERTNTLATLLWKDMYHLFLKALDMDVLYFGGHLLKYFIKTTIKH